MKHFPFKSHLLLLATGLLLIGVMMPLTTFAKSPSSTVRSVNFTVAQVVSEPAKNAITILPDYQRLVEKRTNELERPVRVQAVTPQSYPKNCLGVTGGPYNVVRSVTSLDYDIVAVVNNGCTSALLEGGWNADFQLDCAGVLINESPELTGNIISPLNVGARFTFIDGHYSSRCLEDGGQVAPILVTIFISVSGNLQAGGTALGGTTYTVK